MTSINNNQYEDGDFYYSAEGYIVFTEQYLLKRGFCCENGCKHCPYGFKKKGALSKDSDDKNKDISL